MDIRRKLREQERIEELKRHKEALYQRNGERSAQRKHKLAEELDDNVALVAAVVFYCDRLKPGRCVPAAPIRAHERKLSHKWRRHFKATRRILGVFFNSREDSYRLPRNYSSRLRKVGLTNPEFDSFSAPVFLLHPNVDLENANALRSFAAKHPILQRCREFLLGYQYDYMREVFVKPPEEIKPTTLSAFIGQSATPPDHFSACLLRGLQEKFAGGICNQTDR
jgi:hypothetical protein